MMRREAQALLNRLRTLNSTTKAGVGAPEQNRAVKAGHWAKVTSMSKATTASHEARAGSPMSAVSVGMAAEQPSETTAERPSGVVSVHLAEMITQEAAAAALTFEATISMAAVQKGGKPGEQLTGRADIKAAARDCTTTAGHSTRRAMASRTAEVSHGATIGLPAGATTMGIWAAQDRRTMAEQSTGGTTVQGTAKAHQNSAAMARACEEALVTEGVPWTTEERSTSKNDTRAPGQDYAKMAGRLMEGRNGNEAVTAGQKATIGKPPLMMGMGVAEEQHFETTADDPGGLADEHEAVEVQHEEVTKTLRWRAFMRVAPAADRETTEAQSTNTPDTRAAKHGHNTITRHGATMSKTAETDLETADEQPMRMATMGLAAERSYETMMERPTGIAAVGGAVEARQQPTAMAWVWAAATSTASGHDRPRTEGQGKSRVDTCVAGQDRALVERHSAEGETRSDIAATGQGSTARQAVHMEAVQAAVTQGQELMEAQPIRIEAHHEPAAVTAACGAARSAVVRRDCKEMEKPPAGRMVAAAAGQDCTTMTGHLKGRTVVSLEAETDCAGMAWQPTRLRAVSEGTTGQDHETMAVRQNSMYETMTERQSGTHETMAGRPIGMAGGRAAAGMHRGLAEAVLARRAAKSRRTMEMQPLGRANARVAGPDQRSVAEHLATVTTAGRAAEPSNGLAVRQEQRTMDMGRAMEQKHEAILEQPIELAGARITTGVRQEPAESASAGRAAMCAVTKDNREEAAEQSMSRADIKVAEQRHDMTAGYSMRKAAASRVAETSPGLSVRQPMRTTATDVAAGRNRETRAKRPVRLADVRMAVEAHQQTTVMAWACRTTMSTATAETTGKAEDIRVAGQISERLKNINGDHPNNNNDIYDNSDNIITNNNKAGNAARKKSRADQTRRRSYAARPISEGTQQASASKRASAEERQSTALAKRRRVADDKSKAAEAEHEEATKRRKEGADESIEEGEGPGVTVAVTTTSTMKSTPPSPPPSPPNTIHPPTSAVADTMTRGSSYVRSMTVPSTRDDEPSHRTRLLPLTDYSTPIHTLSTKYINYSTGKGVQAAVGDTNRKTGSITTTSTNEAAEDDPALLTTSSMREQTSDIRSMEQDRDPNPQPPGGRTTEELQRQRPDAIFIDWAKRRFAILEFTRPYDSTKKALLDTDKRKREKYEQLLRRMAELLPGWEGTIATFTLGVKGTVLEPQWKKALRSLNIPDPHHPRVILAAVQGAMEGLDTMLQARSAQLQLGQSVADVPRQPLFPNPQSRQPSLG